MPSSPNQQRRRTTVCRKQHHALENRRISAPLHRRQHTVYTDESKAYNALDPFFDHEAVNHSAGEYVRGAAHTNGIEALWSMFKRGYQGTYHKMSPKHLDRYVTEFAGRHNVREKDTIDQMTGVVSGMAGKRLRYSDLIADNGLDSGAREVGASVQ